MSRAVARSIADVTSGTIHAEVEIQASPERVFRAITDGAEITRWWGDPDQYQTTRWVGDLAKGGKWRAEGVGTDGAPFHVEGEYLEVDPPRKVVMTWKPAWDPGPATTVTYVVEPTKSGARVLVRHEGFGDRAESCRSHGDGWEHVLGWLARDLVPRSKTFLLRLIAPRPTFPFDMTADEREMMGAHAAYWREQLAAGTVVVFGPVADPTGPWGLGIVRVDDDASVERFERGDPAIQSNRGFRYERLPMLNAIF
jgi:uncharacterized protein YndB with AHSA1/START domain